MGPVIHVVSSVGEAAHAIESAGLTPVLIVPTEILKVLGPGEPDDS